MEKARGYCRICQFVRQSSKGTLYCSKDNEEISLNCDCEKFELDCRIKDYVKDYNKKNK